MKKRILILVMTALGAVCQSQSSAQVTKTTLIVATSIVNGGVFKHLDSTVNSTDTFFSKVEISNDTTFVSSFHEKNIMRIGGGIYNDSVGFPLVDPGVLSYGRVKISNDSLFTNFKISKVQQIVPLFPIDSPTIMVTNISPNTTGALLTLSYDNGHDTATITRTVGKDSLFTYSFDSSWKIIIPASGKIVPILGMQSNKQVYFKFKIKNTLTEKNVSGSFITLPTSQKPWIRKTIDSISTSETTINVYGRVIPYGLATAIKALSGSVLLGIDSANGYGETYYHIQIINLNPGTSYWISLFAENAKGKDTLYLGKVTTLTHNNQVFSIKNDSAWREFGSTTVYVIGKISLVSGSTAEAYCGLFSDIECSMALQPSSSPITNFQTGKTNPLYWEFQIDTNNIDVWATFWGYDDKGNFNLTPTPVKVKVVAKKKVTGIKILSKESSFSIYPNPTTDYFTILIPNLKEEKEFEMYDVTGRLVLKQTLINHETQINVSNLAKGLYYTNLGKKLIVQ